MEINIHTTDEEVKKKISKKTNKNIFFRMPHSQTVMLWRHNPVVTTRVMTES